MADFRTSKNSENVLRHTRNLWRKAEATSFSNTAHAEKHLDWLRKLAKLQIEPTRLDPKTKLPLQPTGTQYKEVYSGSFKRAYAGFSEGQQKTLRNILAPSGTGYRSKWLEAFDREILAETPTFGKGTPFILESVERALAGGGRSANESKLLMRFLDKHQRHYRPEEESLRSTLQVPRFLSGSQWAAGQASPGSIFGQLSRSNAVTWQNLGSNSNFGIAKSYRGQTETFASQLEQFSKRFSAMGSGLLNLEVVESGMYPGATQLKGKFGWGKSEINFSIPGMVTEQTPVGVKHVGFTGSNLNVRRLFIPYEVVKKRGVFGPGSSQRFTTQEFFMKTVLEEILPKMESGEATGSQVQRAFTRARGIFTRAELPLGGQYNVTAGQAFHEGITSSAAMAVQPTEGIVVDTASKMPILHEAIEPRYLGEFIGASEGRFGADVAGGRMGQGTVSTYNLEKLQPVQRGVGGHERWDQGIRRTTATSSAVFHAYKDNSSETLTRSSNNLKYQQRAIRKIFADSLVDPDIKKGGEDIFAKDPRTRYERRQRDKSIALRKGEYSRFADWDDTLASSGYNKRSSVLNPGSKNIALDVKSRATLQMDRLGSIHAKIGDSSSIFKLTKDETEALLNVAARKNIPVWGIRELKRAHAGKGRTDQLHREVARGILEDSYDSFKGGAARRRMTGAMTKEARRVYGFGPEALSGPITQEGISGSLKTSKGSVYAGAYYIRGDKIKDISKIPFGSGGNIGLESSRKIFESESPTSMRLFQIPEGLLDTNVTKGRRTYSINEDYILKSNLKKVQIGLDEAFNPVFIKKKQLESGGLRILGVAPIGSKENLGFQIDLVQTRTQEELNKLLGGTRTAGGTLNGNRAVSSVRDQIGNEINSTRDKRIWRNQRFQADLYVLAEAFSNNRRPEQHNLQMLTALIGHQGAMERAYAPEIGDRSLRQGAPWMGDFLKSLRLGGGVKIGGVQGSSSMALASMLGSEDWINADKFRTTVQKGTGMDHRAATKRFMEYFLKSGISSHDIMFKGLQSQGYQKQAIQNIIHADPSRLHLNPDFFSEIFAGAGAHFGDLKAEQMIQEVLDMPVEGFRISTAGGAAQVISDATGTAPIKEVLSHFGFASKDYVAGARGAIIAGSFLHTAADPMSQQGAGKAVSLEPRIFDILQGSSIGKYGDEMAEDLMRRMLHFDRYSGSGKLTINKELFSMLQSTIGDKTPGASALIYEPDIRTSNVTEVMQDIYTQGEIALKDNRELYLRMGDTTTYIPPVDMPGMERHVFYEGGERRKTSALIGTHIRNFVESSLDTHPADANRQFIEDLAGEWAPEGKGIGSYTRGRVPGSFFLTAGKSPILPGKGTLIEGMKGKQYGVHTIDDLGVAMITEEYAKKMKKEMMDLNIYSGDQLESMFSQLRKEKGMAGYLLRHPFIGGHSFQKMRFKIAPGDLKGPTVYIPEASIQFSGDVFNELGENLNQGIRNRRLELGPMRGLLGDWDFDIPGVIAAAPETEVKIRAELTDPEYMKSYIKHQIRYQLMQETETGGASLSQIINDPGMLMHKELLQVEKQALAHHNIGTISTQLTQVKKAAVSYLAGKDLATVQTLMEWIEQKPIGSKKASPEDVQRNLGLLLEGFRSKKRDDIERGLKAFIDTDSAFSHKTSVVLDERTKKDIGKLHGIVFGDNIEGMDLKGVSGTLEQILNRADREKLFIDLRVHRGRGSENAIRREIRNLSRLESAPGVVGAVERMFTNVDQVASNTASSLGKSAITHHKGIKSLAAVGGILALASMSSQPREMVGPGKSLNSKVKMKMNGRKAHKRMAGQDIKPARAPIGNPMGPNILSQRRAMIASHPSPSDHFIVRARASHPNDIGIISEQFQQFALSGGSVNISNSSRSVQNPYGEMNKQY